MNLIIAISSCDIGKGVSGTIGAKEKRMNSRTKTPPKLLKKTGLGISFSSTMGKATAKPNEFKTLAFPSIYLPASAENK